MEAIRILSADAPKAGLRRNAEAFSRDTGQPHEIELATGPVIKQRTAAGQANADLIVIQLSEMDDLVRDGHLDADTVAEIGKVTVGVTVRNGARAPDTSSVEAFTRSLLQADRIIYNTATSGQYVAKMLERIGVADRIRDRTVILPTGIAVMQELAADTSNAIGFGHVTEIRLHDKLGTHLVGPLPGEIGRETPYGVGVLSSSPRGAEARRLASFLISPAARKIFVETGVL